MRQQTSAASVSTDRRQIHQCEGCLLGGASLFLKVEGSRELSFEGITGLAPLLETSKRGFRTRGADDVPARAGGGLSGRGIALRDSGAHPCVCGGHVIVCCEKSE